MLGRGSALLIGLLFFLSGASGLIYETAWTRLFQDLFGHSVHTTAAVVAAFMAGLAIGAAVAGRAAHRLLRPVRAYGLLEIALAVLVWSSPLQVRALDAVLPEMLRGLWVSPGPGDAVRWSLAFVLLLVPTSLMGATLPLLCRALIRDEHRIGSAFGALYGINTIGAVAGVIAAGHWLIRHLGVIATIRVGCGLSLAAGIGALVLSRLGGEGRGDPAQARGEHEARPEQALVAPGLGWIAPVVLVSGFAALAYEIVWFRYFSFILGSSILSFSMVLGTLLLALGLGSAIFPRLVRRRALHLPALGWVELGLGASAGLTVLLFYRFDALLALLSRVAGFDDLFASTAGRSLISAAVLFVPGLLMGAVLPAATGALSEVRAAARGVGLLYAANTFGNILGSLAAGYVLVPLVGSSAALLLLAAVNVGLGVVVLILRGGRSRTPGLVASALTVVALVALWVGAAPGAGRTVFALSNPHATVVAAHEGLRGTVVVYDVAPLPILSANPERPAVAPVAYGYRLIAVDGVDVAGTAPDLRTTQKMQAHIPLLLHGSPRRVLQVGYGSGETTREALLHGLETLRLAEINPDVVEQANRWFPDFATGGYEASFTDAKNLVRTTGERFDVILNDSTYPGITGSSQLYSQDHFRACRERLAAGGVVSTWLPVDLPAETLRLVLATFSSVFEHASLWLPSNCWNKHAVLVGSLQLQEGLVVRLRQGDWPEPVRQSLAQLGYETPEAFLSMLVLDAEDIRQLSEGVAINSDDHPYLEYPARGVRVSGEEFWTETLKLILKRLGPPSFGPPPGGGPDPPRRCADSARMVLSGQLALMQGDPDTALGFYARGELLCAQHPGPAWLRRDVEIFRAQAAFTDALAALRRNEPEAALDLLGRAVALCPQSVAAQFELGRLVLALGRVAEAVAPLERAAEAGDRLPMARLLLGDAYLASGRAAEAEAAYRHYLASHPPHAELLVALAAAVEAQGRREEATALLEQALQLAPGNGAAAAALSRLRGRAEAE